MTEETTTHAEGLVGEHHHSDTFTVPYANIQMTLPGGIYTGVFGVLAVVTVIEVLLSSPLSGALKTIILLTLASSKAVLVMAYYMHLNRDTPLYRGVLLLPGTITLLSILFLIGIRSGVGLGYH